MPILIDIFTKFYRECIIFVLIGAVYLLIFHQGIMHCENAVKLATEKTIQIEKSKAAVIQQKLDNDNKQEIIYSKQLEAELDAERKKPHVNCIVPSDGVRAYNNGTK